MDNGKHSACRVRALPARDFENIIKKCLADLGQNKALIESSIRNSTQFNKKKIKPLQEEIKLEQRIDKWITFHPDFFEGKDKTVFSKYYDEDYLNNPNFSNLKISIF